MTVLSKFCGELLKPQISLSNGGNVVRTQLGLGIYFKILSEMFLYNIINVLGVLGY